MHVIRLTLVVVLSGSATGCNDKSNPAAPSPPAVPTVASLVVSGVDAVLTGVSTTYTATATLSDGTTRAVTPTWTSSNPDVAGVDSAGRFEGRVHGSTTLTASHEGRSASRTVQVVNNYGGTWTGSYVITACDDSGDLKDRDDGWCRRQSRVGNVWSIELRLSQTSSALNEVSGDFYVDGSGPPFVPANIKGAVTSDGHLQLAGNLILLNWWERDEMGRLAVGTWDTNLSGPSTMTGGWSHSLGLVGLQGTVHTQNELVTMTRTPTSVMAASAAR
jgi:hypothetical protein